MRLIWRSWPANDEAGDQGATTTINKLIDKAPEIIRYLPVDGRVGDAIQRGVAEGTRSELSTGVKLAGGIIAGGVLLALLTRR